MSIDDIEYAMEEEYLLKGNNEMDHLQMLEERNAELEEQIGRLTVEGLIKVNELLVEMDMNADDLLDLIKDSKLRPKIT